MNQPPSGPPASLLRTDELLSVRDAALAMGIPKRTLYHWIRIGRMPANMVAGRVVVSIHDIASYLDNPRVKSA